MSLKPPPMSYADARTVVIQATHELQDPSIHPPVVIQKKGLPSAQKPELSEIDQTVADAFATAVGAIMAQIADPTSTDIPYVFRKSFVPAAPTESVPQMLQRKMGQAIKGPQLLAPDEDKLQAVSDTFARALLTARSVDLPTFQAIREARGLTGPELEAIEALNSGLQILKLANRDSVLAMIPRATREKIRNLCKGAEAQSGALTDFVNAAKAENDCKRTLIRKAAPNEQLLTHTAYRLDESEALHDVATYSPEDLAWHKDEHGRYRLGQVKDVDFSATPPALIVGVPDGSSWKEVRIDEQALKDASPLPPGMQFVAGDIEIWSPAVLGEDGAPNILWRRLGDENWAGAKMSADTFATYQRYLEHPGHLAASIDATRALATKRLKAKTNFDKIEALNGASIPLTSITGGAVSAVMDTNEGGRGYQEDSATIVVQTSLDGTQWAGVGLGDMAGGHAKDSDRGAAASSMAIEIFQTVFSERMATGQLTPKEGLQKAVTDAHAEIRRRNRTLHQSGNLPDLRYSMCTTVAYVAIQVPANDDVAPRKIWALNVGDSPIVLARKNPQTGKYERVPDGILYESHSAPAVAVRQGMTPYEASLLPNAASGLHAAIGTQASVNVADYPLREIEAKKGDLLLVMSDGISDAFAYRELAKDSTQLPEDQAIDAVLEQMSNHSSIEDGIRATIAWVNRQVEAGTGKADNQAIVATVIH
jgi:serine/threonine protein phosphatase PrpC